MKKSRRTTAIGIGLSAGLLLGACGDHESRPTRESMSQRDAYEDARYVQERQLLIQLEEDRNNRVTPLVDGVEVKAVEPCTDGKLVWSITRLGDVATLHLMSDLGTQSDQAETHNYHNTLLGHNPGGEVILFATKDSNVEASMLDGGEFSEITITMPTNYQTELLENYGGATFDKTLYTPEPRCDTRVRTALTIIPSVNGENPTFFAQPVDY